MFCGAGSFPHPDEDSPRSPSAPKGSRRKDENNPYAARGLEQFSMVLADLESRREKIMAKAGSQGVAFVRFVYSNSQDWVPIIVRRREPEQKPEKGGGGEDLKKLDAAEEQQAPPRAAEQVGSKVSSGHPEDKGGGLLQQFRFRWRNSYYWPAVVVLILLCLATFGRVFAICCTCMWWYVTPAMKAGEDRNVRRSQKKEYVRRMSDRRLAAGSDEAAASAAGRKAPLGAVDGQASPRARHAVGKRG